MTALLPEAPAKPVAIAGSATVSWRFIEPVRLRAHEPADPKKVCRTKPRDLEPAASLLRVRPLHTANAVAEHEERGALAVQPPSRAMVAATSAVLKSPAANLAFFLSRRPSILGAKHHGKFRA